MFFLRTEFNSTVCGAEHGGGLHVLPDPGGSSSSAVSRDERGEGFFRTFPKVKKSPRFAASPSPRVPAWSSSWTPAAHAGGEASEEYDEYFDTTALCGSRPGTISTSATVGAKSVVKMATASCRFSAALGVPPALLVTWSRAGTLSWPWICAQSTRWRASS